MLIIFVTIPINNKSEHWRKYFWYFVVNWQKSDKTNIVLLCWKFFCVLCFFDLFVLFFVTEECIDWLRAVIKLHSLANLAEISWGSYKRKITKVWEFSFRKTIKISITPNKVKYKKVNHSKMLQFYYEVESNTPIISINQNIWLLQLVKSDFMNFKANIMSDWTKKKRKTKFCNIHLMTAIFSHFCDWLQG